MFICARVSYPLQLELQVVVSGHVGTGIWTQVYLEEKQVLLIAQPTLQPYFYVF